MEKNGSKKRLLLVDPDKEVQDLLQRSLQPGDFEIVAVADWNEAQGRLRSDYPAAIVTEWFEELALDKGPLAQLAKTRVPCFLFSKKDPETFLPQWEKTGFKGAWPKSRKHRLFQALMELGYSDIALDNTVPAAPSPKEQVPCNVLIIDDSPTVRGFIRRALESAFPQFVLREATDGRAALSEMTQKKVDLIFTDLDMPGMDGKTFLRLIRNNPILKTKPIIVLSGSVNQEVMDDLKNVNQIKVLRKPSSPAEIQGTAREMLGSLAV